MASSIAVGKNTLGVLPGETIADAFTRGGYRPDSYLFLVGNTPVPMDMVPDDGTLVKAVRVASGG